MRAALQHVPASAHRHAHLGLVRPRFAAAHAAAAAAGSGQPPRPHAEQQQQQQAVRLPKPPKTFRPPASLADHEGSPFAELGLAEVTDGMGRTRVRQHVNPLTTRYQAPPPTIDWAACFADPGLPLFVDMGCGPGRFLLLLARHNSRAGKPPMNYLGLEIREPLVERANKWAAELSLKGSVHYLFTNVSVSMTGLLSNYPGPVTALAAQFPDPLFKKRHRKRRMVQASVITAARERLAPGGTIFLQSDVLEAVAAMRDEFEQHAGDVLQLAPVHATPDATFQWSIEEEAEVRRAAAAAAAAGAARTKHERLQARMAAQDADRARFNSSTSAPAAAPQSEQPAAAAAASQAAPAAEAAGEGSAASGAGGDAAQQEQPAAAAAVGADEHDSDDFESSWAAGGWLSDNPLGVPTEREHYVMSQGGKVFRVLLTKK